MADTEYLILKCNFESSGVEVVNAYCIYICPLNKYNFTGLKSKNVLIGCISETHNIYTNFEVFAF